MELLYDIPKDIPRRMNASLKNINTFFTWSIHWRCEANQATEMENRIINNSGICRS